MLSGDMAFTISFGKRCWIVATFPPPVPFDHARCHHHASSSVHICIQYVYTKITSILLFGPDMPCHAIKHGFRQVITFLAIAFR